jgi:repressor LexA
MEAWMKGSTEGRKQPNYVVTAARRTVYADIWHFLQDHDSPATVYEVCDAVGLNVSYRLKALPRKGHPQGRATRPHTAEERRSWHPALHIDTDALRGKVSLPSQVGATVLVPVCGRIPGGPLNLANQAVESAFLLDKQPIGEGTLFMLKVTGDSMINAGIADGNWVVVRQQAHAQTGEIVVAMWGVLGREHEYVLSVRAEFAACTASVGDVIGALKQFSVLVPETERVLGAGHMQTLAARNNLAAMTEDAGDKAGARHQLAALLPLAKQALGPRHPLTHAVRGNLFRLNQELGE